MIAILVCSFCPLSFVDSRDLKMAAQSAPKVVLKSTTKMSLNSGEAANSNFSSFIEKHYLNWRWGPMHKSLFLTKYQQKATDLCLVASYVVHKTNWAVVSKPLIIRFLYYAIWNIYLVGCILKRLLTPSLFFTYFYVDTGVVQLSSMTLAAVGLLPSPRPAVLCLACKRRVAKLRMSPKALECHSWAL